MQTQVKLMKKEGLSVYYPPDEFERAIQDASHTHTGEWLSSYQCQLAASAVAFLKIFEDQWLTEEELFSHRMNYLFAPAMTRDKTVMVFVTHRLYLRDILENREINSYIHSPPVFVTKPIAHYLLREYPIHIHVNRERILAENDINLFTIGGLLIAEEEDVRISPESIIEVKTVHNKNLQMSVEQEEAEEVQLMTGLKAASSPIGKGVFKIDEHERALAPDTRIWDKELRANAIILSVHPGETGTVEIKYDDGHEVSISKQTFDQRFVVTETFKGKIEN